MKNTLLWKALSSLDRKERREIERMTLSPFFNRSQAIVRLFDYLQTCLETDVPPDTRRAFVVCYGKQTPYNDQRRRLDNSALLELIETYWIYREQTRDEAARQLALAAAYRQRGLPESAAAVLRAAQKRHEAKPFRHAAYYETSYELGWEFFQQSSSVGRYEAFNLQETADLLDTAYVTRKLRHACYALSHQAVFNTRYRFDLIEAVSAWAERHDATPAVALYYAAYRFLSDPAEEAHFLRFRARLSEYADLFPEEELRALFLLALNYVVKKINEARNAYYRVGLDLYREALRRNLLLENGVLSRFAYNNIVNIAIRLKELDWVAGFIEAYKDLLDKRHRESSFALNTARIAYIRKDYRTALLSLQRADYKDLINNLNAKILQMKIYYACGETELLESHLAGMKNYIRRQAALGYHRDNYLHIVRYAHLLLRCRDAESKAELRRQIEAENALNEKEWFLEQLT